ncbi:MAG: chromate transporter [Firmicutes bacterium]|jgi:chromate transporter|nr:chromate transporter [Bacillota bacterium]
MHAQNTHQPTLNRLAELFFSFFKIGLFTFGGGYAMLPLVEREITDHKKWVNKEEFVDMLAVVQSVPGAIAINTATFIGIKTAGRKGAWAASIGIILPSFIIMVIIAAFFGKFGDHQLIEAAFRGIRPAVAALIAVAALRVGKASLRDLTSWAVAATAVLLIVVFQIHAILIILGGALYGLAVYKFWPQKVNEITKAKDKNNGLS